MSRESERRGIARAVWRLMQKRGVFVGYPRHIREAVRDETVARVMAQQEREAEHRVLHGDPQAKRPMGLIHAGGA